MPNETDTKNTNALQPGQKAYAVLRSDGKRVIVVGYAAWVAEDWFIVDMTQEAGKDNRYCQFFRPIVTTEITEEEYAAEVAE